MTADLSHEPSARARTARILLFSRTSGYRHESIETGVEALRRALVEFDIEVVATEDESDFTAEGLGQAGAVVWLSTSGDVLDDEGRNVFQRYVERGGGYVGIHGASDTEHGWDFYGELVGARFDEHPHIQPATVHVVDREHPATSHLPSIWPRTDEWYNFESQPHDRVRVLATVDESSYEGGTMGEHHPIAWCHETGGARSFYTAMGHTTDCYAEVAFIDHLVGGIRWTLHRT